MEFSLEYFELISSFVIANAVYAPNLDFLKTKKYFPFSNEQLLLTPGCISSSLTVL